MMRLPDPPWTVGLVRGLAEDYEDRRYITAWVWCDRLQWMCISFLLVELIRWLVK